MWRGNERKVVLVQNRLQPDMRQLLLLTGLWRFLLGIGPISVSAGQQFSFMDKSWQADWLNAFLVQSW